MGSIFLRGGDGSDAADTELSLRTGGGSSSSSSPLPASPQALPSPAASTPASPQGGHHQPLTIFYGGRICVCDVTEVQARAILAAAQMGSTTEEREAAAPAAAAREAQGEVAGEQLPRGGVSSRPVVDVVRQPSQQLRPGLSMKVSLQRFLQKRKGRGVVPATPQSRRRLPTRVLSTTFALIVTFNNSSSSSGGRLCSCRRERVDDEGEIKLRTVVDEIYSMSSAAST